MTVLNRRDVLKGALGAFASWTSVRVLSAQQAFGGVRRLTDQMTVVDGGGSNVLACFTGDGFVLVDGGAPKSFDRIMASLGANASVHTLFNTHHHVDQTGNNDMFSTGTQGTPLRRSGRTRIIAHKRTLEWMSADHWIQADDRYERARPKVARPTETFLTTGSLTAGGEQIDYGYLTLAHTNGDIYVHFRNANVLAVGDVASLGANAKVHTLFNTHHHADQTGNNELFSTRAKVIAHKRTLEWMSADHWIQGDDRYERARPKVARPTEAFLTTGSLTAAGEQIDYGYLTLAHTNGDIYVHFRNANVLAVGDVASPLRDPALDYVTGAWIGGRVDSMDVLLTLANEQTRIVPAYGPVLSKAEFKAERDMMEEVRKRLFNQVREGDSPRDMLERGVLKGLARTWNDPYKFLYDAAKGLWAHHDKLGPNVV